MPRKIVSFFSFFGICILVLNFTSTSANAAVGDLGPEIVGIAASDNFTCMNAKTGEVYCWGQSTNSNLGTGMEFDNAVPHKVYEITDSIKVDTGNMFACSLSSTGIVACWGKNSVGQIGDGYQDSKDRIFPSYVAALRNVTDIALGESHACALISEGKVFCWGDNKFGQLGNKTSPASQLVVTIENSNVPLEIEIPEEIVAITAGSNHTCGLSKSSFVYCWGSNFIGQLGLGYQNISYSKPAVVPALKNVTLVKSHYDSTCAKTVELGLYCWGRGTSGELGETEKIDRYLPRLMSGTYSITDAKTNVATAYTYANSLSKFAFGTNGGCGIDGKSGLGYLVCWGKNTGYEPTSVQALDVALGRNHGCLITITKTVSCWGSNLYGQTGSDTKSATWQSSTVLKGIPEWKNYVTSWGISYSNNVATITWTGAAESKFRLNVDQFGVVCEVVSVFNCQVGILKSNTEYSVTLTAIGLTSVNSRYAMFTFKTGTLLSAQEELAVNQQAAAAASAAAAAEKLKKELEAQKAAAIEAAKLKLEAYKNICENRKDQLSDEISVKADAILSKYNDEVSQLKPITSKLSPKLSGSNLNSIKKLVLAIYSNFSKLSLLEEIPQNYACTGDVRNDSTNILLEEEKINVILKATNSDISAYLGKWKFLLLSKK